MCIRDRSGAAIPACAPGPASPGTSGFSRSRGSSTPPRRPAPRTTSRGWASPPAAVLGRVGPGCGLGG
eukprot:2711149-Alexandrium_andersonii.AAC.1